MMSKITPRNAYTHIKVVGDFKFVSETSSRCVDTSIVGVVMIDQMGNFLNIETKIRAV
jgi:2-aminomuconate deaminase